MAENPCQKEVTELRDAIWAWVKALEASRQFTVSIPVDQYEEPDTYPPDYFRKMEEAYKKEKEAREHYMKANQALYSCKEKHGLLD
jgi:hypothetical protein